MSEDAHRAALEDQREFLLRSLDDLEREHEAGDVDDHDYAALRDDYTVRAARVLRALGAGERDGTLATDAAPRRSWRRTLVAGVGVLAFAVLAGVLAAQAGGRRDEGDTITGGVRQSVTEELNEAGRLGSQGDYDGAVELYDKVLAQEPDNAEALTYKGWMLSLSGNMSDGLTALLGAATAHPNYPDVHAFLAVVLFRNGLVDQAGRELDRLDALNPPPDIRQLTDSLRVQITAAQSADTTTSTTTAATAP
jgi:tetratricopeptide (TPR) repeat protein